MRPLIGIVQKTLKLLKLDGFSNEKRTFKMVGYDLTSEQYEALKEGNKLSLVYKEFNDLKKILKEKGNAHREKFSSLGPDEQEIFDKEAKEAKLQLHTAKRSIDADPEQLKKLNDSLQEITSSLEISFPIIEKMNYNFYVTGRYSCNPDTETKISSASFGLS